MSFREAREGLRSPDVERVEDSIESIATYPTPESVTAVIELLQSGPVDRITDKAIEALGILARPEAISELSVLMRHRRPAARVEALEALAEIQDPRVRPLLEAGLGDSAPEVRGTAARSLGKIGARASIPLLFRAFERGVPEAAESIGQIGSPEDALSTEPARDMQDPRRVTGRQTLAMWLTHAPIGVILGGFQRFLDRRDIPVAIRVKIIERLEQRAASAQVRDFLQRWVQSRRRGYTGADLTRANLAIRQIQGGGR
ncbi:MAG: HEAT repeat domain-containing protein [Deltaproteobacteria bacterium]|nr:HEAT repeat domain-containing protein [Deltaproteobacteria bacterium]